MIKSISIPGVKLSRKEKEALGFAAGATLVVGLFAVGFGVGAGSAMLIEKIRRRDTISGEGDGWDEDPIVAYAKEL